MGTLIIYPNILKTVPNSVALIALWTSSDRFIVPSLNDLIIGQFDAKINIIVKRLIIFKMGHVKFFEFMFNSKSWAYYLARSKFGFVIP